MMKILKFWGCIAVCLILVMIIRGVFLSDYWPADVVLMLWTGASIVVALDDT